MEVLGFKQPRIWGEPPAFAMTDRDGMVVMLSRQDQHELIRPKEDIWDMYFWVRDVKSVYEEFQSKGAELTQHLKHIELYGNDEFILKDPDGYALAFGQEVEDIPDPNNENKTEFLHMNPVFASQDVRRDVKWYEDKLGFRKAFDSGDMPLNYAGISRRGLFLHMQYQFPKDMWSSDLRIQVRNIEPLFKEYLGKGLVTENALRMNTPWRTNEFGLFDLSGNRIHFYEDI